MTKNFCDSCGKEVGSDELVGMYSRLIRQYTPDMQPHMGRQEYLLCQKCQEEVSSKIEQMKNEYQQSPCVEEVPSALGGR